MKMKHLFDFKLELATKTWSMFAAVLLLTITTSCEEEVYPEAGSLPDKHLLRLLLVLRKELVLITNGKLSPFQPVIKCHRL